MPWGNSRAPLTEHVSVATQKAAPATREVDGEALAEEVAAMTKVFGFMYTVSSVLR